MSSMKTTTTDELLLKTSEIEVNKCTVVAAGPKFIDFKHVVLEINYFEDIFTSTVSGSIIINDSNSNYNSMSWCGDEFLLLELNKPLNEDEKLVPLKGIFRIYSISSRHLSGRDTNENLVLNFCSEEAYLSSRMKLSKSYTQKTISDIVIDIAINELKIPPEKLGYSSKTKTYANVEPTFAKYDIVIPNLRPLEAINWLCTMAIADTNSGGHAGLEGGATYFFYKNRYGWYFKTILSIFNNFETSKYKYPFGTGEIEGYWYGAKNVEYKGKEGDDYIKFDVNSQIISYEVVDSFDGVGKNLKSLMSNKLIAVDYLRRTHEEKNFDYNKYFNEFLKKKVELYKNHNSFPILSNAEDRFKKKHNEYQTTWKVFPSTTNQKNNEYIKERQPNITANYVENTIPYRFVQIGLLFHNRLKLQIPGDPYISVGKLIYVHIPQATTTADGKPRDRFLKGWYLVSAIRQKVTQSDHQTIIECVKDSYNSELDSNIDGTQQQIGLSQFDNSNTMIVQIRQDKFEW